MTGNSANDMNNSPLTFSLNSSATVPEPATFSLIASVVLLGFAIRGFRHSRKASEQIEKLCGP